jgi:class 3 adenylate cyclase
VHDVRCIVGGPAEGIPAGGAAVAERRLCSVLFCDLVGFTPLAEARDPEAVRELLSAYLGTAREIIGRYGGVTEKFIGDAVMAVWGTPAEKEQDAERAVRAALDLLAAVSQLGHDEDVPQLAARGIRHQCFVARELVRGWGTARLSFGRTVTGVTRPGPETVTVLVNTVWTPSRT